MTFLDLRDVRIETGRVGGERFSLSIPAIQGQAGDRIALIGDSGAGKTTVLECLALLTRPAALGAYRLGVGGQVVDLTAPMAAGTLHRLAGFRAAHIGYVPQSGGLLPFVSAAENARVTVRASGHRLTHALRHRIDHAVERLGLDAHMGKGRGQLSGGERKRVAIVRALAMPRAVLLADEPTAGLDERRATAAMDLIVRAADRDGSVCVIATHDVDLARAYGFSLQQVTRQGPARALVLPQGDLRPASGKVAECV
jgi:putative ABC transport system ATP-binding protein